MWCSARVSGRRERKWRQGRCAPVCVTAAALMILLLAGTSQVPGEVVRPAGADFDDILFIKRERLSRAENRGNHMCDQYFGFNQIRHPKNGLYVLKDTFSGTPRVVNLLENAVVENGRRLGERLEGGAFLSPNISYCGTQVVFAYTDARRGYHEWDESTVFHLYRVNIDGTGLVQLTDGVWNDFDPVFLPDGDIAFISERRGGFGRCHMRPVPTYTLHRMRPDGSHIRTISYHETNEWNPAVDHQGMLLYTRWDYVDRGATHAHSAWITTPDGLDPRPITLNYPIARPGRMRRPATTIQGIPLMQMSLRAIPGSHKLVGTAAEHHGQNYGSLIVIDPDIEDDDHTATFTNITVRTNGQGFPESGGGGTRYATPYPLSETQFLCVYDPHEGREKYGIHLLDITDGEERLTRLYHDPEISALSPIPVRARPRPNALAVSRPPGEEDPHPVGRVMVANVYDALIPFPEGTRIAQLRIWQVYPKTTANSDSPRISYEALQSAWAGRNTRGLLGTVPVEEDGSAYFTLPSGVPVFFQAVDEQGTAVQTMRSNATIVPGQSFMSCQGCHEPRHTVPVNPAEMPMAMRRPASGITPDPTPGARPMSFARLIQPVLDRKCIACHDGSGEQPDLRDIDAGPGWSRAYVNLRPFTFLFDDSFGGDWDIVYPRTIPGEFGARASRLYPHLKGGHGELTPEELHRFVIWLDSGIAPFYGVYHDTARQRAGEQVEPVLE